MMTSVKDKVLRNLFNIPGFRTGRKIVVFESDDWGSIRMPSRQSFDKLLKSGIRVDQCQYNSLDSLENELDLQALFEVLDSVRTHNNRPAIFTFNTIMANPDFEKIRQSHFSEYHYEDLFQSYKHYYGKDLKPLWKHAIDLKLMQPQFHGREHINASLWMKDLAAGKKELLLSFNEGFFGLKTATSSSNQRNYLTTYCAVSESEIQQVAEITREGLRLFEEMFGFKSRSFIACKYVWPTELERTLQQQGVKYLQCERAQRVPQQGRFQNKYHYTGQRNELGQIFTVRNAYFEPYIRSDADWVESCFREISQSFLCGKPAVISSHRINFVSNMSMSHRDSNLKGLQALLKKIMQRWPEAEFLSSDELGDLIAGGKNQ